MESECVWSLPSPLSLSLHLFSPSLLFSLTHIFVALFSAHNEPHNLSGLICTDINLFFFSLSLSSFLSLSSQLRPSIFSLLLPLSLLSLSLQFRSSYTAPPPLSTSAALPPLAPFSDGCALASPSLSFFLSLSLSLPLSLSLSLPPSFDRRKEQPLSERRPGKKHSATL